MTTFAVTLVGEDRLCCHLGARLVTSVLPNWRIAPEPIVSGGITKLIPSLHRYARAARFGSPVLCVADADGGCPVALTQQWWPPKERNARMLLRLAVNEAESWVLADHDAMLAGFKVPTSRLPDAPDELVDPKAQLLRLLHRYAPAALRRDMVEVRPDGQPCRNSGYAVHLQTFVTHRWQPTRAAARSPSLRRALARLADWAKWVAIQ